MRVELENASGTRECEWNVCYLYTHFCEFSKSLDGDRARDRLLQCRLVLSFQEGPHQKSFFQVKKTFFLQILQGSW